MLKFEIRLIESVNSTNQYLLGLIDQGEVAEGLVIRANEQTNGRGHGSNSWESEPEKNLTFSLVLCPQFIEPSGQFLLTKIISIAITKVLLNKLPTDDITIKWPNDIYIGNKKIAGILIQNLIRGHTIGYSIVGIGLNVNQEIFTSDAPNPVSMIHFSKSEFQLEPLLMNLLEQIKGLYTISGSISGRKQIDALYLKKLYRFSQWNLFKSGELCFKGKVIGTDEFGRLLVMNKKEETSEYDFKEIEFII